MTTMSWCRLRELRHAFPNARSYCTKDASNREATPRVSEIHIQLLSESLHKQIFGRSKTAANGTVVKDGLPPMRASGKAAEQDNTDSINVIKTMSERLLPKVKEHLKNHELWDITTPLSKDVDMTLPEFLGGNVEEHFLNLGRKQTQDYVAYADQLCNTPLPTKPGQWAYMPGWVRYEDGDIPVPIEYPDEGVLVFDVETLVKDGNYPVMATAVSLTHWYSWCSDYLATEKFRWSKGIQLSDLIPLEPSNHGNKNIAYKQRLVIGHNVGFDRSYVKEQYYVQKSKLRFMDTMSMHIAVCGLTSFQRILYKASKNDSQQKVVLEYREKQRQQRRHNLIIEDWKKVSTLNNLHDVHKLHVGGSELNKDPRDVFVEGSMEDVRENFQDLMEYCASDVVATTEVFKVLWPEFNERFPHPVTLAGMMEMSTGYLPVNQNWERFKNQSYNVKDDMQREVKQLLVKLASDACQHLKNDQYKDDPWLWDLDWTTKPFKIKKAKLTKKEKQRLEDEAAERQAAAAVAGDDVDPDTVISEALHAVLALPDLHYKVGNNLCGYPEWYRALCSQTKDEDWSPGPNKISAQTRVTPKLLRLTWDGYPLHFDDTHGWGYLVPGRTDNLPGSRGASTGTEIHFPYKQMCELLKFKHPSSEDAVDVDDVDNCSVTMATGSHDNVTDGDFEDLMNDMMNGLIDKDSDRYRRLQDLQASRDDGKVKNVGDINGVTHGNVTDGDFEDVMNAMMNGLTDKDSDRYRRLQELQASRDDGKVKKKRVKKAKPWNHEGDGPHDSVNIPGCWFFKIPHKDGKGKRVGNPLSKNYLSKLEDGTLSAQSALGADHVLKLHKACTYWIHNQKRIESQMYVWMKDEDLPDTIKQSSDYIEGSNLGAIVPRIAPAGTVTRRAVEPLWLTASNAYTDRIGSELKAMIQSPPGHCFVGADVDSQELWIGALLGDAHFAKSHGCTALGWMTLQGNKKDATDLHSKVANVVGISRDHAKIFNYGRIYGAGQPFAEKLLQQFNHRLTLEQAKEKAQLMFTTTKGKRNGYMGQWQGGSESAMFNMLETIARQDRSVTPVLGCRITKALETENVNNDFMTSRINWVVQSSAVDYLHLMLVCMNWLLEEYDIDARFSISIHDEVRYLVSEKDKYRAALALQVTNLLTRSMFASKLGMKDLPLSVAFFSAVDIDVCLRKEVTMDCITPSNPHGLEQGYQIPEGEALDIQEIMKITGGQLKMPPSTQASHGIDMTATAENSAREDRNGSRNNSDTNTAEMYA